MGEVLQKSLKVWVKCDYSEALHIEMHVHTPNLNTYNVLNIPSTHGSTKETTH